MLKIHINKNFTNEKEYMIKVLFGDFLGLEYTLHKSDTEENYIFILENGNKMVIKDAFFSGFQSISEYLKKDNVPNKVKYAKNKFTPEKDIPIIYGENNLEIKDFNGKKTIFCAIDIFASSFFMLTRWEEYTNETRDEHDRFPATASLAYKQGFLDRPIVNEYTEMLWNMLKFLGYEKKRNKRNYKVIITHDIDKPYKWPTISKLLSNIAGDILIRKSLSEAFETLKTYILVKVKMKRDPFDTFDFLMDTSEKYGLKSYFFFMAGGDSKYDNGYNLDDHFIMNTFTKINQRGHFIGFHPSYKSYDNENIWNKEFEKISISSPQSVDYVRQHYLRFRTPKTWLIANKNKLKWDSTLSYADCEGFRCGTCYEFKTFDFFSQKPLDLIEQPLIVMDTTLITYQGYSPKKIMERIKYFSDVIRKYNGNFVILWHNTTLEKFNTHYEKILNTYVEK